MPRTALHLEEDEEHSDSGVVVVNGGLCLNPLDHSVNQLIYLDAPVEPHT
jgi:hypothetical protein